MQAQDFSLKKVSQIMTPKVHSVGPDTVVLEAIKKMASFNIGAIVVTDKDAKAIGIFTERDLMNRVVAQGRDPAATLIREAMTANPTALGSNALISEAFHILQNQGMRHLILVDDNVLAGIVSIKDINKFLINAMESALNQLNDAIKQLIEAEQMNALGEFAGGITHELNQPLNITKIICQSLLRDIQKERFSTQEAQTELPEIVKQMNRMSEILTHISVFTRRSASTAAQACDINLLLKNILNCIRQQYKDHNIELIENFSTGLAPIIGDSVRLEQACFNLLSNAHYAVINSNKNGKKIYVKTYSAKEANELVIEIADNGMGIPDQDKDKLFQPFFSTKGPGIGTGMGLVVCKKIIEEHQGRLEFETKAGEGTVFRIVLPVKT